MFFLWTVYSNLNPFKGMTLKELYNIIIKVVSIGYNILRN